MIIYRIEHPENGKGPYRQYEPLTLNGIAINDYHADFTTHPSPRREFADKDEYGYVRDYFYMPDDYYCGFISIEQLLTWFESEWIDVMHIHGYFLCEYEVPDLCVRIGHFQCIFKMERAKLVQKELV